MPGPNLTIISNQHANTVNSPDYWITLLALTVPGTTIYPSATLYVAQSDSDVIYQGQRYTAFDFDFPNVESKPGELPQFQVRLTNVSKAAHRLLEQYEGGTGGAAKFMIVSSLDLDGASPAQTWEFEILSATAKDDYATVSLGGENPMRRQFPTCTYQNDNCQWVYNSPVRRAQLDPAGAVCGYLGDAATCDHTLNGTNGCVAHGNEARFGAHPGVSSQGFRTAVID